MLMVQPVNDNTTIKGRKFAAFAIDSNEVSIIELWMRNCISFSMFL